MCEYVKSFFFFRILFCKSKSMYVYIEGGKVRKSKVFYVEIWKIICRSKQKRKYVML